MSLPTASQLSGKGFYQQYPSIPIVTFGFSWRTLLRFKFGKRLKRVFESSPKSGEFRLYATGVFEFSQRDAKLPIRIDYEYMTQ